MSGTIEPGHGLHAEILNARQARSLRRFAPRITEAGFYLGGGTAVALHLGHRRSIDFDWFRQEPIVDPLLLAEDLRAGGAPFVTAWTARGTLYGAAQGVRASFFEYRYKLLAPLTAWPETGCSVASLKDLACMKLSAIAQRGSRKDFIDLYAIATAGHSLTAMLAEYQEKFEVKEVGHLLYALSYFDDADVERMPRMIRRQTWPEIKQSLQRWVQKISG
jgi:hypothetical protein